MYFSVGYKVISTERHFQYTYSIIALHSTIDNNILYLVEVQYV